MSGEGPVDWFKSWTPLSHTAYRDDGDVIAALARLIRRVLWRAVQPVLQSRR